MPPGRLWHLPACFDADFAPDLSRLAKTKGLSHHEVVQRLISSIFRIYMLGSNRALPT